jgi:hypothetical protein
MFVLSFLSVSESGSGSTLPDPDSLVRGMDPDPDSDPDLDPLVRGMDPRIRIHSKMLWIRNTGFDFVDITRAPANTLTPLQQSPGLYWHSHEIYCTSTLSASTSTLMAFLCALTDFTNILTALSWPFRNVFVHMSSKTIYFEEKLRRSHNWVFVKSVRVHVKVIRVLVEAVRVLVYWECH